VPQEQSQTSQEPQMNPHISNERIVQILNEEFAKGTKELMAELDAMKAGKGAQKK